MAPPQRDFEAPSQRGYGTPTNTVCVSSGRPMPPLALVRTTVRRAIHLSSCDRSRALLGMS